MNSESSGATSAAGGEYDFDRLERVISELVDAHQTALRDNTGLLSDLEDQNRHIRNLEGQLLEANQRRQDVVKRIDELIAQIDLLENQLPDADG